jgi:hypothetical protein
VPITFAKLGATTTTVQVEAVATQVNTTDASLGNVITSEAIVELPMYARNIVGLLAAQPGVTLFGSPGQGGLDSRSGSVNGGKSDQANVMLDGADVNDQNARSAFTTVLRVTPDSAVRRRMATRQPAAALAPMSRWSLSPERTRSTARCTTTAVARKRRRTASSTIAPA